MRGQAMTASRDESAGKMLKLALKSAPSQSAASALVVPRSWYGSSTTYDCGLGGAGVVGQEDLGQKE